MAYSFEEDFYTEKEVASLLKVSRKTLYNWRKSNIGPIFQLLPTVRYPKKELDKWYKGQQVRTDTTAKVFSESRTA